MKIQIEDYFGNDVLILEYVKVINTTHIKIELVNEIAETCGYNVADVEDDATIRVQQCNVDNTEKEEKADLLELVNKFNNQFL